MIDPVTHLTPEEKLLLSLCRLDFSEERKAEISRLMSETVDWDRFIKLSNEHGLIAISRNNITKTGNSANIPQEYLGILHNGYLRNLTRNTWLYEQLDRILELIKGEDIKVVLLKGMALEKTVYGNQGLRQMTDIDILVNREDVLKFKEILIRNGFKSEPFKSPIYRYLMPYLNTHIPRLTKGDCHVEIHNKLFDQRDNSLSEKILESSTPLRINEHQVFIPPPQLFFLYLISHLEHHMTSGDAQLRMYLDIYLLICSHYEEIINDNLINYTVETNLQKQLTRVVYLLKVYWNLDFPTWLNDQITQYDHSKETDEFLHFLKRPVDGPNKKVSSNYIKQINIIPGFFRKILYMTGFLFPSPAFMKKRYKAGSKSRAVLYYPVRWLKTLWRLGR